MVSMHLVNDALRVTTASGPIGSDSDLSDAIPSGLTLEDWIVAGVTLVAFVVVGRIARQLIVKVIRRTDVDEVIAGLAGRIVQNLFVFVGVFYALSSLGVQVGPLVGALGLSGIAVAIAVTSILENVFASVVLKTRKPIVRGDQVDTNDHSGTVEEINFRTVVLRDFDGQRVIVPSSEVNENPIVNRTTNGISRSTITIGVAYATDLRTAQSVLLEATAGTDGVLSSPPAEALVVNFGASSIDFDVRFWHAPDIATTMSVRSEVAIALHEALGAAGISIPFPQRVVTMVRDESVRDDG